MTVISNAHNRSDQKKPKQTWSHLFDGIIIDKVVIVLVQTAVQRDAVTLEQQIMQGVDAGDAQGLLHAIWQVRVIEYHIEAEDFGSQGYSCPHTP